MQYGRMILVSFGYLFVVMFLSLPISLVCSFYLYKRYAFQVIVVILFLPNILRHSGGITGNSSTPSPGFSKL
ncbi:MAG: hypothetical protein ACLRSW_05460 [Christensenellaceae bacterium]